MVHTVRTDGANNQLHRIAALVLLTLLRQVHISFESYDGLIAKVEPLYSVCEWAKEFSKHGTVEIVTYMGAFGHVEARRRMILTTLSTMESLARVCPTTQELSDNIDDGIDTFMCDHTFKFGTCVADALLKFMPSKVSVVEHLRVCVESQEQVWDTTVAMIYDAIDRVFGIQGEESGEPVPPHPQPCDQLIVDCSVDRDIALYVSRLRARAGFSERATSPRDVVHVSDDEGGT
jgi:hypothetical protein